MQSKLEQLFSTPPQESDRFRSNNMKKITRVSEYLIHSLATLGQLLTEMQQGEEVPALRYLVDTDKTAWFARESQDTGPAAPAHYQMTGNAQNAAFCKTAGNLFLSEDYSTLIRINHKSGDFRPTFASIKWILAILAINEDRLPFKLPEVLTIEELDHNGKVQNTHQYAITDIRNWLKTFAENTPLTSDLKKQDATTKTVHYESPGRRLLQTEDHPTPIPFNVKKARRLGFEDDKPLEEENLPTPLFDEPVRPSGTFRALRNTSLFAPKKLNPRAQPVPLFAEQELPTPEVSESSGPGTPPPLKKRKPRQLSFVSSLAQPNESEADEASTSTPSFFKGYF
ncbi:hypothetical protein [Legionella saoudiensis]|uniref:hypothetical protein n=1 Tax=Legionella saoudiensis TaxID=1750561 RepID=UPI00073029D2|nr:hypothetical protein [Legionella saoudiensis]